MRNTEEARAGLLMNPQPQVTRMLEAPSVKLNFAKTDPIQGSPLIVSHGDREART